MYGTIDLFTPRRSFEIYHNEIDVLRGLSSKFFKESFHKEVVITFSSSSRLISIFSRIHYFIHRMTSSCTVIFLYLNFQMD